MIIITTLSNAATTLWNYNDIVELDTQHTQHTHSLSLSLSLSLSFSFSREKIPLRVQVNDVAGVLTATWSTNYKLCCELWRVVTPFRGI